MAAVNQRQRADGHSQLGMARREGGGGLNELVAALGWLVGSQPRPVLVLRRFAYSQAAETAATSDAGTQRRLARHDSSHQRCLLLLDQPFLSSAPVKISHS